MTITEAIDQLQKQRATYGEVEVYFDCPQCGESFTPNRVVAVAVHLTTRKKTSK